MQTNIRKTSFFVLPVLFQSVSFHHRSKYQIKIHVKSQKGAQAHLGLKKRVNFQDKQSHMSSIDHFQSTDAYIQQKEYRTNAFQIDFNDQHIKFKTGMLAQINCKNTIKITFELVKITQKPIEHTKIQQKDSKRPQILKQEIVSTYDLNINLGKLKNAQMNINQFNYRKIVFPQTQYISSLDIAFHFCSEGFDYKYSPLSNPFSSAYRKQRISSSCGVCCKKQQNLFITPQLQIQNLYQKAILNKLQIYNQLKNKIQLRRKIYQEMASILSASRLMQKNKKIQQKIIKKQIQSLNQVALKTIVSHTQILSENNASVLKNSSLINDVRQSETQNRLKNNSLTLDDSLQPASKTIIKQLCQHYECDPEQICMFIYQQSKLLQINIRYLFQMLIQLQFVLSQTMHPYIVQNQIKRIDQFVKIGQKMLKKYVKVNTPAFQTIDFYPKYTRLVNSSIKELANYSQIQLYQPMIVTENEQKHTKMTPNNVQRTLTILIHGYKGTQHDLSKIKAYLFIYLGLTNFYALKNLSSQQNNKSNIQNLGQIAAAQISDYLNVYPSYRHVNVIGFSMGGVIARAMLPRLHDHRSKLNLLMTLGSPHLGIREVDSCLVRTGMMFIRRFGQVQAIKQLNVQRNQNQNRYMHELSKGQGLEWFKSIIMVGAIDDHYVPLYSSTVHYKGDSQMITEMSKNLRKALKNAIFCAAKLQTIQSVWDKLTHRGVHISILQQDCFIKYLIVKFRHYFVNSVV